MNNLATLPHGLQQQIATLATRIRWLLLLRRTGRILLLLVLFFAAVYLADQLFGLPALWLRILCALLTVGMLTGIAALIVSLLRPVEPQALAALIERKYPELAERLTSTVSLMRASQANGSKALIALLIEEAEVAARGIDVPQVVDARPAKRWALIGVLSLAFAIMPAFVLSAYADFGDRFLLSWFRPINDFIITATPANGAFAIGRPLTITAHLQARSRHLRLPTECSLVWQDGAGAWQRIEMAATKNDYACVLQGPAVDLRYYIEAGGNVSDTLELKAVQPVSFSAESPTVTISPPDYARGADILVGRGRLESLPHRPLDAFEFAKIQIVVECDRPPLRGHLQITPINDATEHHLPLQISTGSKSADITLPALLIGAYQLSVQVEAEHAIATFQEIGTLNIRKDAPPMLSVSGPSASRSLDAAAPADDTVSLQYNVMDDLGVGAVDFEYQVNDAPAKMKSILEGGAKPQVSGDIRFRLRGEVKTGDTLRYRVKASDVRNISKASQRGLAGQSLPMADLTPQSTWWPVEQGGWQVLKIRDSAEALVKQNILSDRDKIAKWIDAIRGKMVLEKNHLDKFRRDSFHQPITAAAQEKQLNGVREENREVRAELNLFAHQTSEHELLAALSTLAADIAAKEIEQTGAALAKAQEERGAADSRDRQVVAADNALNTALNRLGELARRNEQLAEYRLDQMQLDKLAEEQEILAGRAAELAKGDPAKNPELAQQLAAIRAEQEKIAAEFARLTKQSAFFQQAMKQAMAEKARQLGQQTQELAQEQTKLAQGMRDREKQQMDREVAILAEKQRALAVKVKGLGERSPSVAKEKGLDLLDASFTHNAATALAAADLQQALQEQIASETELDRFAFELSGAGVWDPRKTAQRMLAQQSALRKKLEQLGKDLVRLSAEETVKQLRLVTQEQHDIAVEIAKLAQSKGGNAAGYAEVRTRLAEAVEQLQRAEALAAHQHMEQAETILDRIATAAPSAAEHRQHIANELTQLRAAQQKIADEIVNNKQAGPRLNGKLAELATDQERIIKRIGDLPTTTTTQGVLQKRLLDALAAMQEDLRQGSVDKVLQTAPQMPVAIDQFKGILLGLIQAEAKEPESPASTFAAQSRGLAAEQHELRLEVEKLFGGEMAAGTPEEIAMKQAELEQQKKLAEKAGKLSNELKDLGEKNGKPEAMQFAQQAEDAMKKASAGGKSGEEAEKAAEMLKKSAEKSAEMAKEIAEPDENLPFDFKRPEMAKTGESLMEGKDKTDFAKRELDKNDPQAAPKAMQQAAKAMDQAAKQAAKQLANMQRQKGPAPADSQTPQPALGSGTPGNLPGELSDFAARPWGELPGSLRTQIVQDLRARYGEDYARIIQLYFERIAEAK